MNILIKTDKKLYTNTIITIETPMITPELEHLINFLSIYESYHIIGKKEYDDVNLYTLKPTEIIRFYSYNKHVYAKTEHDNYLIKERLYELTERLSPHIFLRISNTEIINKNEIIKIDFSLKGTISFTMSNNDICYASRRYIKEIKEFLK